jgi:asparagine synthase (glutamine-hydrolysing)
MSAQEEDMCGIAGIFRSKLPNAEIVACVKRMLGYLKHRGPDEIGYYIDETVGMGTTRLSIVDVLGGKQPFADCTRRYWLSFNGEIYNYKELRSQLSRDGFVFTSNSDTEVLLNAWIAWGPATFSRLNGAFAFSLYDRQEGTIVLARDRFGKRPLYYLTDGDALLFSSEMKCLLAYDSFSFEFDSEQLLSILRVWTPFDDQTGFKRIRQVPAGHYLYADRGSNKVTAFEVRSEASAANILSAPEAELMLRQAMKQSVGARLPDNTDCGVYLSGGVDSAIITSLVSDIRPQSTRTFSIEFVDEEFDESSDQQRIAKHFGTRHTALPIQTKDIVDSFPIALWHAEIPVFRSAFVPMYLLSREVKRQGVKVVLTGEGADEVFLGYDIFKETLLREEWSTLDVATRKLKLAGLYPYLAQFSEQDQIPLYSFFDRFAQLPRTELFSHDIRFHNSKISERLLTIKGDGLKYLRKYASTQFQQINALSSLNRAQFLEVETLLSGYLLSTQGDRMCLAHGVENRCPFLDPAVVQLGALTNLRFNDGFEDKYLLRRAFAEQLPSAIAKKPKRPFRAPDARAFLECRPAYLELIRSEHELNKLKVVDARFCSKFVNKVMAKSHSKIGQAENQTFMFLLSIACLHEQFMGNARRPPADIDAFVVGQMDCRGQP